MDFDLNCPLPLRHDTVQMAHGGGGRVMRELIEKLLLPAFDNPALNARHDAALLPLGQEHLAFTTDTFVVRPRFFPGGDIGKLAVHGTVNDLAMAGAKPLFLSVGLILEEGYPMEELSRVVASLRDAALLCGVSIVTGDTKVVDKGHGDGLYINTTGIGLAPPNLRIDPSQVRPGDAVIVSGDVGRHGMAVMSVRENLSFDAPIESDCGPVHHLAQALLEGGLDVHCMRDPTRGGLAAVLNEIALDGGVGIEAEESLIPVDGTVRAACEILGLDPYYVACEGRMVLMLPGAQADAALAILRRFPEGSGAARIGTVTDTDRGMVLVKTSLGTKRILDLLSGEQLPRIC